MSVIRTLAALGVVTTVFALGACSKSTTDAGSGGLSGQTPATSPSVPGSAPASAPPTSDATSTATATGTHTAAPSARIVSFTIVQQPSCPVVGTSDAPESIPGQDIKLAWKTSGGVTKVALSIDDNGANFKATGNGSVGNYAANGTMELSFECNLTDQPNTTHTYTLDTIGGGKSVQQTLTVTKQTSP
jgi:hypothetical protein